MKYFYNIPKSNLPQSTHNIETNCYSLSINGKFSLNMQLYLMQLYNISKPTVNVLLIILKNISYHHWLCLINVLIKGYRLTSSKNKKKCEILNMRNPLSLSEKAKRKN